MSDLGNRLWAFVLDPAMGNRKIPTQCALAQDIKQRHPELHRPYVDQTEIRFTDPVTGIRYIWPTPPEVADWVLDFDNGRNPKAMTVTLWERDAVKQLMRTGQKRSASPKAPVGPNAPKKPARKRTR